MHFRFLPQHYSVRWQGLSKHASGAVAGEPGMWRWSLNLEEHCRHCAIPEGRDQPHLFFQPLSGFSVKKMALPVPFYSLPLLGHLNVRQKHFFLHRGHRPLGMCLTLTNHTAFGNLSLYLQLWQNKTWNHGHLFPSHSCQRQWKLFKCMELKP